MSAFQLAEQIPVRKTINFDGSANNGAVGFVHIFYITGVVLVRIFASKCDADLVGAAARISVGVTGQTELFLPLTLATDIDAGEVWGGATPKKGMAVPATCKDIVVDAQSDPTPDIFATIDTADITGGTLNFYALWTPLELGARLTVT